MEKLADKFFESMRTHHTLECRVEDALLEAFDVDVSSGKFPFGNWIFDDYDGSFELHGTRPDWVPTPEQLTRAFALGFERCWVVYTDGFERYYSPGHLVSATKDSHGRGGERTEGEYAYRLRKRLEAFERERPVPQE